MAFPLWAWLVWDEAWEDRWGEKWDFVHTWVIWPSVSLSKLHILEPMWHFDIRVYFITLRGLEYNETSVSLTTSSFEGV